MKKLILIIIIISSCKKEEKQSFTSIKVVESVTDLPVSDATMVLFRCDYGCVLGPTVFFKGVTDNNGTCQVPSEHFYDASSVMNVVKTKYWPFEIQKNTVVSIIPEGWLQLRIHKVNNYPVGSKLLLNVFSQSGTRSDLTDYNTVVDSLIFVKAFGGQQNRINYQVVDVNYNLLKDGTSIEIQIPRFDTLKNAFLNY